MPYNIFAVSFVLGTSLPTDGPGLSARIRCMLCPPAIGKTARINTNTPIPPIQWVKLRQKRLHLESTSTSLSTLAPVVVKPDMVSNSASIKLGISPFKTNGIAPTILITIQLNATVTKPSRAKNTWLSGFLCVTIKPIIKETIDVIKKEYPLASPYIAATTHGKSRNIA
ncbi:hypothetical protein SDC9_119657 [bioreactor metagenome]|uniref:Uncharacterized protein n=1 Tax=bioreactor metagenome TaxID=1076179 RepID=A0A645C6R7_9ZZZZ